MANIATQISISGTALSQDNTLKREVLFDFLLMTGMFLGSFASVYLIGGVFNYIYFLIPLLLFWRTEKKDYFWFAYFFVIMTQPAFFFAQKDANAICRVPLYKLGPLGSFVSEDLFMIIATVKAFLKGKERKLKINNPLVYIGIYFMLVSIPMTLFFGVEDFHAILNSMRSVIYYFLLFAFVRLMKDEEDLIKFGYIISPYIFLIIFNQFYVLNFGKQFIDNYDPQGWSVLSNSVTGAVRADMGFQFGIILILYVMIFSLQIKGFKKYELFNGFSDILTAAVILSIFISATRMFTVVSILMVAVYTLLSEKKQIGRLLKIAGAGAVLFFLLQYADVLKDDAIKNAMSRFNVVFQAVEEDDVYQTDTFQARLEDDYPRVFDEISKSPFLGVGLSTEFYDAYSNDIGWPNTVMLLGIVGAGMFFFYYAKVVFFYLSYRKNLKNDELKRNIACAFAAGLAGLFLGYMTTYDFFGFYPHKIFFISVLFGTTDILRQS
ncbi:hypothetical protein HGB07_03080 [Candidatus Roizmanbacteria bacterium]|nr:hypothetical protein [Candidatus Roizmanbacteria bacterium]